MLQFIDMEPVESNKPNDVHAQPITDVVVPPKEQPEKAAQAGADIPKKPTKQEKNIAAPASTRAVPVVAILVAATVFAALCALIYIAYRNGT